MYCRGFLYRNRFILTIVILFFSTNLFSKYACAQITDKEFEDSFYLISFMITLQHNGIESLKSISDTHIGYLQGGSFDLTYAQTILKTNGNFDSILSMKPVGLEQVIQKLQNNEVSIFFVTLPLNRFITSVLYKNPKIKFISMPLPLIKKLQEKYPFYKYNYHSCKLSKVSGNIEDIEILNFLVSSTRHVRIDNVITIGVVLADAHSETYNKSITNGLRIAKLLRPNVLGKEIKFILQSLPGKKVKQVNQAELTSLVTKLEKEHNVNAILNFLPYTAAQIFNITAFIRNIPVISPMISKLSSQTFPVVESRPPTLLFNSDSKLIAKYLIKKQKNINAAVIIKTSSGISTNKANDFRHHMEVITNKPVIRIPFESIGPDDYPHLVKVIETENPSFIYAPIGQHDSRILSRKLKTYDISIPILYASLNTYFPAVWTLDNVSSQFILHDHPDSPSRSDLSNLFYKKYKEIIKDAPNDLSILSADSFFLLINSIARAKTSDRFQIRIALSNTKMYQGISGLFQISKDGYINKNLPIFKYKIGFRRDRFEHYATLDGKTGSFIKAPNKVLGTLLPEEVFSILYFYNRGKQFYWSRIGKKPQNIIK